MTARRWPRCTCAPSGLIARSNPLCEARVQLLERATNGSADTAGRRLRSGSSVAAPARRERRCGASIPEKLAQKFEVAERDDRTELLALAHATALCTDLLEGGVDHLHFYTLNKPGLTRDVVHALGLAPEAELAEVA